MCPSPRRNLLSPSATGSLGLLIGAFLFAVSNTLAKTIYFRGVSLATLFLIRGVVVYALNALRVFVQRGRAEALRVAALRVGGRRLVAMCVARSACGFVGIAMLNVAFMLMNFADAFALSLGTLCLSTIFFARVCLGRAERLSWRAAIGVVLALIGIVFVAQPKALFDGVPPSAMGTLLGIVSGTLFGTFGIFSRVLGRAGAASPPMLVSYYMVVIEVGTAGLALLALALGPETAPPWAIPAWPTHDGRAAAEAAALVALYCLTILSGQLLLAFGYGRLQAGRAAVLALSELGFAWLCGVVVLREATNALACVGTLAIFVGSALAATAAAPPTTPAKLADADAAAAASKEDWTPAAEPEPGDRL